ncbi:MAG TPA: iron-containing alcohol dehydrogenase family protein [Clostridia bacterium]|nr:iron-containing alcohol dehydrogenase family protein [Clostridia bacterium]
MPLIFSKADNNTYAGEIAMQFKFHMPVKTYFGEGCLLKNGSELSKYGRKAVIVTGGHSARLSGALSDVCSILEQLDIAYAIYDKVQNNPTLDNVREGGILARENGAGFVIGIGGGSPLDAAKAVAVLAVNDMEPEQLFTNDFKVSPLPVIAIPTTAGTGSEVTPYSILTRTDKQTKISFGTPETFPAIAFLDPHYTESQPLKVTINTAVDALSHSMEGYLGKRRTPAADILAREGIKLFGSCLESLRSANIGPRTREMLLYASMLGGMVIAHTGTTIMHGIGYNYTYFKGIPHGEANGYLMAEYLRFNYSCAKDRIDDMLQLMGLKDIDELDTVLAELIGRAPGLTREEISLYAAITMTQKSTATNIRPVEAQDLEGILERLKNR